MTTPSRTIAALVVFVLLLFIGAYFLYTPSPVSRNSPTDFPANFQFEIVTSHEDRARGLSFRSDIPHDYGMFFVFPDPARYGFWMKDMLVPIDIIWLADDGTIKGIEQSVSPDTFPQSFTSPVPIRYVLETRAGEAARNGWEVGTRLKLPVP